MSDELVTFRREHDLSQADLARLLESAGAAVSVRTVQGWEQGRRAMPSWVSAILSRLSKKEIRELERTPRKTRPVGVATPHRRK
jgi:DNA-binding transcriptional regulator YiaG